MCPLGRRPRRLRQSPSLNRCRHRPQWQPCLRIRARPFQQRKSRRPSSCWTRRHPRPWCRQQQRRQPAMLIFCHGSPYGPHPIPGRYRVDYGSATVTLSYTVDGEGNTVDDSVAVVADASSATRPAFLDMFANEVRKTVERYRYEFDEPSDGACRKRQRLTRTVCVPVQSLTGSASAGTAMVPGERLELSHGCPYQILSLARLPISPPRPGGGAADSRVRCSRLAFAACVVERRARAPRTMIPRV